MNYSGIIKCDVANGEGIRLSLFVSGCQFHCPDCFNQDSQNYNYGDEYTSSTTEEIINYIKQDTISGLSLLGGDPLWQKPEGLIHLINLCQKVHELHKNVWIWSGFTWEQIFAPCEYQDYNETKALRQELIMNSDVWVDGPFEKDKKDITLKWRGSSNQRVIDVKKTLEKGEIVLYEK